MTHPLWPLLGLRLTTGELEPRLPREEELPAFSQVIEQGIHPPDEMPFGIPWTREPSPARERSSYQWWMSARGNWKPDDWTLTLGVWVKGEPAGYQDLVAREFAAVRTVRTGSWLGQRFQRRGIGKQMRQAVLALAFDHLSAIPATSSRELLRRSWSRSPHRSGPGRERIASRRADHCGVHRDCCGLTPIARTEVPSTHPSAAATCAEPPIATPMPTLELATFTSPIQPSGFGAAQG